MKIFVIESPSPIDLLNERKKAKNLVDLCRMFEHQVAAFCVKSKSELISTLNYLKNIELQKDDYTIFHFISHGNKDGLIFGNDILNWLNFTEVLKPLLNNNSLGLKYSLIISACSANNQEITNHISEFISEPPEKNNPPEYIISYNSNIVLWTDLLLSWSILYHKFSNQKKIRRGKILEVMKKMEHIGILEFKYYRWDKNIMKYKFNHYS